jgi:hypothetical protein
VSREVCSLKRRVNKSTNDQGLCIAWVGEWFVKHVAFVTNELTPVFEAAGRRLPEGLAAEYCEQSQAEMAAAESMVHLLTEWESTKPQRLAAILEARLCTNES